MASCSSQQSFAALLHHGSTYTSHSNRTALTPDVDGKGDQSEAATAPPATAAATLLSRVSVEAPSLCTGLQDDLQQALTRHDHPSQWVAARVLAACAAPASDAEERESPLAVVQRLLELAAGGAAACSYHKAATFAVHALVRLLGMDDAAHRLRYAAAEVVCKCPFSSTTLMVPMFSYTLLYNLKKTTHQCIT